MIFEEIGRRILMIKDIQKKIGVVFQFNIHKKGLPTKTWILDGKSEKPVCYPGKFDQNFDNFDNFYNFYNFFDFKNLLV